MKSSLHSAGLKNTCRRAALIEILDKSAIPLSAEDIYTALKATDLNVNRSTVYRALKAMSDKALINKVIIASRTEALYEKAKKMHSHYLVCLSCGAIITLNECPLKGYNNLIEESTGFTVTGHRLELYGLCKNCLI